jgi:hypothetical protein
VLRPHTALGQLEGAGQHLALICVPLPIENKRRGGRKLVLAPNGAEITSAPLTRHVDNAMVKAIARAFRLRDMLESGECATIRDIAAAEKISETYVLVASCG